MSSYENYQNCSGRNCIAEPVSATAAQTGQIQTACPDCPLIYRVASDRTAYDKYWLQYYNSKANATNYDLLSLQFAQ